MTRDECASHEFECDNAMCITVDSVCDGNDDCVDGSDERNCSTFCCLHSLCMMLNSNMTSLLPIVKLCMLNGKF